MNYLIVDDHPKMRQAVIEALFHPGDLFIEADNGEDAVNLYDRATPDWVIMDVKMPGQGGLVSTSQIVGRHPRARVVMLSQHDSPELREAAREAGATAYLSKENLSDLERLLFELNTKLTKPL